MQALPEFIVFTLSYHLQTVLGDLTNQLFGHRLIVWNLEKVLGCLMWLKLFGKNVKSLFAGSKVAMRFMPRKREQESRLDEERSIPLDRLFRIGGNAF